VVIAALGWSWKLSAIAPMRERRPATGIASAGAGKASGAGGSNRIAAAPASRAASTKFRPCAPKPAIATKASPGFTSRLSITRPVTARSADRPSSSGSSSLSSMARVIAAPLRRARAWFRHRPSP
jgi:hypothetical protein